MRLERRSDGLLSAKQTLSLLELVRDGDQEGVTKEGLINSLAALTPISWSRAANTIVKLCDYEVISTSEEGVLGNEADGSVDLRDLIARAVAEELVDRLTAKNAWYCTKLEPSNNSILLDSMTLPTTDDGLSTWIVEFGIAIRNHIEPRHWKIADQYKEFLLTSARKQNANKSEGGKSAELLAKDIDKQEELGKIAEEWVVQFERNRLSNHLLCDQVRRISEESVSAGYDILSFTFDSSLTHDLFIEVKSHGSEKRFYWSRNEIDTAKSLGERYALYLVDRHHMNDSEYEPHIISAPTPELFARADSGWRVEATSFEHVAIEK